MGIVIILILVGILLLVTEIILLPGISVAGFGAIIAFIAATAIGFLRYGLTGGTLALTAIVILTVIAVIISLRANTWRKFTLNSTIDSTSIPTPSQRHIHVGDRGTTLTRLAPMGKVQLGDTLIEAKSIDRFIDQRTPVEVVGFENTVIIVRAMESVREDAQYAPAAKDGNTDNA